MLRKSSGVCVVVGWVLCAVLVPQSTQASGVCEVTLVLKDGGTTLATWVNGSGPADVFLATGRSYTFQASCNCSSHNVGITSSFGMSAGPSPAPSNSYSFSTASSSVNDQWVTATCCDTNASSTGTFTVVMMKLQRIGNITIQPSNCYSENATIRVSAVFAGGWYCTAFKGWVDIAESGTAIYSQNTTLGAVLPASVNIANDEGYTDFTAKSLADAATIWTTPPGPAVLTTTNYQVYGGTLSVPQWVDNNSNSRRDWCEQWVDTLLSAYRQRGGEVGGVANSVAYVAPDALVLNTYGQMHAWGSYAFWINPAAQNLRVNAARDLEGTVLHEARHVFQDYDCDRENVGENNGDGPNNDDDAGTGDHLPEMVYYASETGTSGIKDGVDPSPPLPRSAGDGIVDSHALIVSPAIEADATDFEQNK